VRRVGIWFVAAALAAVTLTSARDAAAADFTVTTQGMTAYLINSAANPTLSLTRGQTYAFALTTPGHPFYVKMVQGAGTGGTFDEGVTNNGATSGTLTFTVPADAPSTLFYDCSIHPAMTGLLAITSPPPPPPPVPAGDGVTRAARRDAGPAGDGGVRSSARAAPRVSPPRNVTSRVAPASMTRYGNATPSVSIASAFQRGSVRGMTDPAATGMEPVSAKGT
jgi:hypothetical protein